MTKLKPRSPSRGTTIQALLDRSHSHLNRARDNRSGSDGGSGGGRLKRSNTLPINWKETQSHQAGLSHSSSSSSSSSRSSSLTTQSSMIMLPQVRSLDLEVFQTLPVELQREFSCIYLQHPNDLPDKYLRVFQNVLQEEELSWIAADTEEKRDLQAFLNAAMSDVLGEQDMIVVKTYLQQYTLTEELKGVLMEMMEKRCQFDLYGTNQFVTWMASVVENRQDWSLFIQHLQQLIRCRINSL